MLWYLEYVTYRLRNNVLYFGVQNDALGTHGRALEMCDMVRGVFMCNTMLRLCPTCNSLTWMVGLS